MRVPIPIPIRYRDDVKYILFNCRVLPNTYSYYIDLLANTATTLEMMTCTVGFAYNVTRCAYILIMTRPRQHIGYCFKSLFPRFEHARRAD